MKPWYTVPHLLYNISLSCGRYDVRIPAATDQRCSNMYSDSAQRSATGIVHVTAEVAC